MLEAGPPYQKLLNGYLNFFDCGNNRQSFAREVANWNAEDLEQALTNAGLPGLSCVHTSGVARPSPGHGTRRDAADRDRQDS